MTPQVKLFPLLCWLLLILFAGASMALAEAAVDCLGCHGSGNEVENFNHSIHGRVFTGQGSSACQSCHGSGEAHSKNPAKNAVERRFGDDDDSSQLNDVCLGCHRDGHQKGWAASDHAMADLSCTSCHSIHVSKDPILQSISQADTCFECHTGLRASHRKLSRHPIAEGIMSCSSCHQPHGGKGPSLLVEATVNETCFQCHAEKRGPMLFEHEPVQDNCLNCHNPHGSVNDNMLVTRQPLLCQQCHIASRHPGTNYITGEALVGMDNRLIGKSCVNCHSQVHGSNHPAGFTFRR